MKYVLGAMALLLVVLLATPRTAPVSLIGTWQGSLADSSLELTLRPDETFVLALHASGGQEAVLSGNYSLDMTRTPIALTLRQMPNALHAIHTSLDIIDNNTVLMAQFAPWQSLRPTVLTQAKSFFLKRTQQSTP